MWEIMTNAICTGHFIRCYGHSARSSKRMSRDCRPLSSSLLGRMWWGRRKGFFFICVFLWLCNKQQQREKRWSRKKKGPSIYTFMHIMIIYGLEGTFCRTIVIKMCLASYGETLSEMCRITNNRTCPGSGSNRNQNVLLLRNVHVSH